MRNGVGVMIAIVAAVLSIACAATSMAAGYVQIEAVPLAEPDAAGDPLWVIYIDGEIETGAATRLADLLARQRISRAAVYFNSPGGSLLEGMAIGRLLRERKFATYVGRRAADPGRPTPGVCYSACPFAYAGGTMRILDDGSVLGLHRARNRVPVSDEAVFEQRVSSDATQYLVSMGISTELVRLMAEVSPGEIRLLTREEAERLGLVNAAPAVRDPAAL